MAGSGRRVFAAGEVLTASNVMNYLQDQAVMVFASSTARATAITSPAEGMISYLQDTNFFEVYDATAASWKRIFSSDQTIRLDNSNAGTISSTDHALQIGPTSSQNSRFDPNSVQGANNGAVNPYYINPDGGSVYLGAASSTTIINGRMDSAHTPWAMSAGSSTTSSSGNLTVTLTAGRFTQAPIVNVTSMGGANAVTMPYVASTGTANFTVSLYTTAGARVAQVVHWQAIQMTSAGAAG